MSKTMKPNYDYIDGDALRKIVSETSTLTQAQISACLGYSSSWLSQACTAGRMGKDDISRLKDLLNIDASPAVISEERWAQQNWKGVLESNDNEAPRLNVEKLIGDFSYERSADAIKIAESIDRLTNIVAELVTVLKG